MAWTMGGYDSSNMMLTMSDYSSKESLVAMLGACQQLPSLGGKPSSILPKRHFWPFMDDQDDEASEDRGTNDSPQQKKKRLNPEQVRSLEMSFNKDNKLEPGRKQQLADRLELQPRQVAVWFQNRRARWKAKQLEHDFSVLKTKYDCVVDEVERLRSEVARLTAESESRQKDIASSAHTKDKQLQVKAGVPMSQQVCCPESEKAISASSAYSDYSYVVNVASSPDGSPAVNDPEDLLERAICYHEAVHGKAESLAFTYVPSQSCFGSMDHHNVMNQHLAIKNEECFPSEEPYGNHVAIDCLWALT